MNDYIQAETRVYHKDFFVVPAFFVILYNKKMNDYLQAETGVYPSSRTVQQVCVSVCLCVCVSALST
jgi:hypothetical protein